LHFNNCLNPVNHVNQELSNIVAALKSRDSICEHKFRAYGAGDPNKISHLLELQSLGNLEIFGADLGVGEDFDAPISGCELVFQFATPANFASDDPEVDSTLILHYNFFFH